MIEQIFTAIGQHFLTHIQAYATAAGVFLFTGIANMPKPGIKWTKEVMYVWLYDTLQTVLPLNRGSHQIPQIPQIPQVPQLTPTQAEKPATTVLPRYFR